MSTATESDPIHALATEALGSKFLCERAARLWDLARWIAGFAEFQTVAYDSRAVHAATWFHDAWCCEDVRAGRFSAPLVLALQPTDLQRERSADIVREVLGDAVPAPTVATAARAVREAGSYETPLPEAQIVGEAVNLDSIGPLWLWGQAARCAAEDRPVASAVAVWERHVEYRYWIKRISETLRYEPSRRLARHRCEAVDGTLAALRDQLTGGDIQCAPTVPGE